MFECVFKKVDIYHMCIVNEACTYDLLLKSGKRKYPKTIQNVMHVTTWISTAPIVGLILKANDEIYSS